MKNPVRLRSKAFTLMEMILVLAIIALLIGVGTATMTGVLGGAKDGRAQGDIASISAALIQYHTAAGRFPTSGEGLNALVTRPTSYPEGKSYRPLMKPAGIIDPWTNEYQYRYPGTENEGRYDVWSLGEDGNDGTEDDVTNW